MTMMMMMMNYRLQFCYSYIPLKDVLNLPLQWFYQNIRRDSSHYAAAPPDQTWEDDVFKMDKPILMQSSTSGPRGKIEVIRGSRLIVGTVDASLSTPWSLVAVLISVMLGRCDLGLMLLIHLVNCHKWIQRAMSVHTPLIYSHSVEWKREQ